jgi:hypothetical protein
MLVQRLASSVHKSICGVLTSCTQYMHFMQDIAAALEEEERAEDTSDDKKFTEFHMIGEVCVTDSEYYLY